MWRRTLVCLSAVGLLGVWQIIGCGAQAVTLGDVPDGGDNLDGTSGDIDGADGNGNRDGSGASSDGGPVCKGAGDACSTGPDCCSSACDPSAKKCIAGVGPGNCKTGGAACTSSTECCNLTCVGGSCGATACVADNEACTSNAACCGGTCTSGTCTPLNTTCKTSGNACAASAECCSKLCQGGHCQIAASYCVQTGDVCADGNECCGGVCTKAAGATLGICGVPPSGGTNCGGGIDGVVCDGCTDCCSRLCAPFLSGVKICQPANGCHIEGNLCQTNRDCCGGDDTTGLPGNGNVKCLISAGYTIGICRSPTSGTDAGTGACNPEGNVCHYKDYVCGSSSSAQNNCCLHLGSKTNCELDPLGIPRCNAIGADGGPPCRANGQTCAFTGDCCTGAPCVPGPTGQLVCYAGPSGGPDGGTLCVPTTGPCTVNADCCTGGYCKIPPGSTQGTCTTIPGSGGGGDGGTTGGDAGGTGTGTTCSLYGQSCASNANCCNGIPCTGTDGFSPCFAGQAGCSCVYSTPR